METPSVLASFEGSAELVCNISYPSSEDLMSSVPTLGWETRLMNVDISDQSSQTVGDKYFESVLSISSVNSSYCGIYTCVALDNHVALPTTANATINVGKFCPFAVTIQYRSS